MESIIKILQNITLSPTVDIKLPNKNEIIKYNLFGLILHEGNLQGGHYTCYYRNSNSKNIESEDDKENPWV